MAVGNIGGAPDIITDPLAIGRRDVHVAPTALGDPDVRVFFNSHLIKTGGSLAPDREFLAYAAGVESGVRVALARRSQSRWSAGHRHRSGSLERRGCAGL